MQYAGAFAAFVVSKTADLGRKVGRIVSHKSLKELNGEPSNKTPAWTGDKLFGWEVTKILHGTGLNSTGKLTNHHSYYTRAFPGKAMQISGIGCPACCGTGA
jgi:hypothetical protein